MARTGKLSDPIPDKVANRHKRLPHPLPLATVKDVFCSQLFNHRPMF